MRQRALRSVVHRHRLIVARFTALAALLCLGLACLPSHAQDITGTWQGTTTGKAQRIEVKITKGTAPGWQAVVYSLDSNTPSEGRAATQISLQGAQLRFAIAPIDTSYQGKLSADGATIAGTWTQNGTASPLTLAHVSQDAAWAIPNPDTPMAKDADPDWDVVVVKPMDPNNTGAGETMSMEGRKIAIVNKTVENILEAGYGVDKTQVVGAPGWLATERWDIEGLPNVPGEPNLKQLQSLLQKLLAERFGLKLHRETKELAVYAITVAKGGEKMAHSVGDPNGTLDERDGRNGGVVTMRLTNASMSEFAWALMYFVGRPAVDQTGLPGRYDFQLKWTEDQTRAPTDGSAPPGLFTAIQEQIGLKLEPVKAPTEVLVVDVVHRPSGN